MSARPAVVAGTLLLGLTVPAGAQAVPTIEPLRPCYVAAMTRSGPDTERVVVRAAGFTPNSKVDLTRDGALIEGSAGLQVDDHGQLLLDGKYAIPAPFVKRGTKDFTITLTEQGNPANTVSATAQVTKLGVGIRPATAAPSDRIRFTGSGFTAERPVYAHYIRKNEQVARVRMTRRPGACGTWTARRRQFPMDRPHQGRWVVQFDQSKKYVKAGSRRFPGVYVQVEFRISLVRG